MAGKKILVVEDEVIVAMDLQSRLEILGYSVVGISTSGEDAVKKSVQFQPDLIMMDIKLNGLDGILAARLIHEKMDIPVIFMSAFSDEGTLERSRQAKPYGYITKPFDEDELAVTIEYAFLKFKLTPKGFTSGVFDYPLGKSLQMVVERLKQESRTDRLASLLGEELFKIGIGSILLKADFAGKETLTLFSLSLPEKILSLVERVLGINLVGYNLPKEKWLSPEIVKSEIAVQIADPAAHIIAALPKAPDYLIANFFHSKVSNHASTVYYLPLCSEGQVLGALVAWSDQFNPGDLGLMEQFSLEVSQVFKEAQFFRSSSRVSITDDLTGLFNRRYFIELVERQFQRSTRTHEPFSIIVLDIDRFQWVLEQYGLAAGNTVLKQVVKRLSPVLGKLDVMARDQGDTFLIFLPGKDRAEAIKTAESLRVLTASKPFDLGFQQVKLTASLGVVTLPENSPGVSALLGSAAQALFTAKQNGRNCVRSA